MFSLIIELNDAAVIEIINSTIIKVWKLNICVGYSAKNPNFEDISIEEFVPWYYHITFGLTVEDQTIQKLVTEDPWCSY